MTSLKHYDCYDCGREKHVFLTQGKYLRAIIAAFSNRCISPFFSPSIKAARNTSRGHEQVFLAITRCARNEVCNCTVCKSTRRIARKLDIHALCVSLVANQTSALRDLNQKLCDYVAVRDSCTPSELKNTKKIFILL